MIKGFRVSIDTVAPTKQMIAVMQLIAVMKEICGVAGRYVCVFSAIKIVSFLKKKKKKLW